MTTLIRDLHLSGRAAFERLAVTPAQIAELNLPTAPPKPSDRRRFEGETVQAEAIAPDVLVRIVREAIEARIDPAALAATLAREERDRERLMTDLDRLATAR